MDRLAVIVGAVVLLYLLTAAPSTTQLRRLSQESASSAVSL